MSSASPETILLKQRIAELEEKLRRVNLEAEFLAKTIEIAEGSMGIDITKIYHDRISGKSDPPAPEQE